MTRMHNPPHPGEILWGLYMEPADLTVTQVAKNLGVDRKTISRLIHGHTSVSVDLALKLAKAFDNSPELWLGLQQAHDLWNAKKEKQVDVSGIKMFPKASSGSTDARV